MRDILIILGSFIVGLVLALTGVIPADLDISTISKYVLYLLMFLVGFNLGKDEQTLKLIKKQPLSTLFLPFATMIGTFVGALAAYCAIQVLWKLSVTPDLSLLDTLSVSAGFGYYSLSSILINEVRGAELGTIALASNILRELITIAFAPVMVKWFKNFAPISSGGATTADKTLPIIQRYAGNQYVPLSILHGAVVDFSVPVYLTLFFSLM